MQLAYKFNEAAKTEYQDFETEKGSLIELKQRLIDSGVLTRDEKDKLQNRLMNNSYSKTGVPIAGWMFDFYGYLKVYVVKQYGSWNEVHAFDKTAIRNNTYGKIDAIKEL